MYIPCKYYIMSNRYNMRSIFFQFLGMPKILKIINSSKKKIFLYNLLRRCDVCWLLLLPTCLSLTKVHRRNFAYTIINFVMLHSRLYIIIANRYIYIRMNWPIAKLKGIWLYEYKYCLCFRFWILIFYDISILKYFISTYNSTTYLCKNRYKNTYISLKNQHIWCIIIH